MRFNIKNRVFIRYGQTGWIKKVSYPFHKRRTRTMHTVHGPKATLPTTEPTQPPTLPDCPNSNPFRSTPHVPHAKGVTSDI